MDSGFSNEFRIFKQAPEGVRRQPRRHGSPASSSFGLTPPRSRENLITVDVPVRVAGGAGQTAERAGAAMSVPRPNSMHCIGRDIGVPPRTGARSWVWVLI
jgi:hypothetical protein